MEIDEITEKSNTKLSGILKNFLYMYFYREGFVYDINILT